MLPKQVADEIINVASRTQRSTAFIVLRALMAAPKDALAAAGPTALMLALDDDDPATTLSKIKTTVGKRPLDEAVSGAWAETRQRFSKWLDKEATAREAENADDLDQGLTAAKDPRTSATALNDLAGSEYPRVRALVAVHPATEASTLAKLAQDREPYVRAAVEKRSEAS